MTHTSLGNIALGAPGSGARKQGNLDAFMAEYQKQLTLAVKGAPGLYAYPVENVPQVCERMRQAFAKDSYSLDSLAIRATCRVFGIKCTRTAIREALTQ